MWETGKNKHKYEKELTAIEKYSLWNKISINGIQPSLGAVEEIITELKITPFIKKLQQTSFSMLPLGWHSL